MLLNNYCQFFEPLTKKVTVNSKIVDLLSHSLFHLLRVKITATYQGLIQIITNDVNNKLETLNWFLVIYFQISHSEKNVIRAVYSEILCDGYSSDVFNNNTTGVILRHEWTGSSKVIPRPHIKTGVELLCFTE